MKIAAFVVIIFNIVFYLGLKFYRVATLPRNLEFDNLCKKKNIEKPRILYIFNMFSSIILI